MNKKTMQLTERTEVILTRNGANVSFAGIELRGGDTIYVAVLKIPCGWYYHKETMPLGKFKTRKALDEAFRAEVIRRADNFEPNDVVTARMNEIVREWIADGMRGDCFDRDTSYCYNDMKDYAEVTGAVLKAIADSYKTLAAKDAEEKKGTAAA